jgi:hypothetical protein
VGSLTSHNPIGLRGLIRRALLLHLEIYCRYQRGGGGGCVTSSGLPFQSSSSRRRRRCYCC